MLCWLRFSRRWEDEKWMVSDRGSECDEVGRVAALVLQPSAPADLNSPAGTSSGGRIPTYQPDGHRIISEAQVVEPTQGCGPSPAQLLPSCPALALDQRQAARRGTGLMMARAMPSLSRPSPRVQFWLMLFPADKMKTSSFYLLFLIGHLGGEGRVSEIRDWVHALFHHQLVGCCLALLAAPMPAIAVDYFKISEQW